MNKEIFILGAIAAGLILGFTASYLVQNSSDRCSQIQEDIRSGQNFTGTVSCYPPGVIDANISDQVQNQTDLECVCRKVNDGRVQLFPILKAS